LENIEPKNLTEGQGREILAHARANGLALTVTTLRGNTMHKHMLRTLGLSLIAALGLVAFSAANALAAPEPGQVLVEGSTTLANERTVGAKQEGEGTLLVPGLNIEIVCQKLAAGTNTKVISGSAGTALAEILYQECVVWSTEGSPQKLIEILKSCQILASGVTKTVGDITATGVGKVLLKEKGSTETYLLAEGETVGGVVQPFATVEFTKGIGCPLATPVKITGTAAFKVGAGNLNTSPEVVEPLVESSGAIQKALGGVLKYGINEAFIDGSALLKLTGSHEGLKWGAK
jgi:hypothetical protein